jgi:hypothetical protein
MHVCLSRSQLCAVGIFVICGKSLIAAMIEKGITVLHAPSDMLALRVSRQVAIRT